MIVAAIVLISCPTLIKENELSNEAYKEYPITIEVFEKHISEGIETFEAEVSVYRMNSRNDSGFTLTNKYQLSSQEINGEKITRIDYSDNHPAEFRSVITNGDFFIFFNPDSEQASQRIESQMPNNQAYRLLNSQNYLSKVNLSLLRQEAQRVSLDILADDVNTLIISVPPELTQTINGERRLSTKLSFNVKDEILESTETVTIAENGATITVTVTPRYEKIDEVPIKTGQLTVTKVDIPPISEYPYEGDIFNSPEDIPTISNEEYERLNRQGMIHKRDGIVFGDPNDLSYIETEVELYSTIKVNNTKALSLKFFWLKVVHYIVDPVGALVLDLFLTNPKREDPLKPGGHLGYDDSNFDLLPPGETVDGKILYAKVSERSKINGHNVYYFSGFDFNNYRPSKFGLLDIINQEYQVISRGGTYENIHSGSDYNVSKSDNPYVLIGHSEGGIRTLGYATYTEKLKNDGRDTEEFDKLKGIITISGANKGFKAMEGGVILLLYKLFNIADILAGGLRAINILAPSHYINTPSFSDTFRTVGLNYLLVFLTGPFAEKIRPIIDQSPDTINEELAAIRDLVPFSSFANTYVCDAKVQVYKRKIGHTAKLILFPIPHMTYVNEYEYYSVYRDENIRFNRDLPVAYIAGTDNNTIGMANEYEGLDEIEIRKIIDGLALALLIAGNYHKSISVTTLGISNIFMDTERAAQDAEKARNFLINIDNELNKLKGSPDNDGFLAVESMYYKEGNVILSDDGNLYTRVDANHAGIASDPRTAIELNFYLERMIPDDEN